MSFASGIGIELDEVGRTALIGVLLVPAFKWVAGAPNGKQMAQRTAISTALIVGMAMLGAGVGRKQG